MTNDEITAAVNKAMAQSCTRDRIMQAMALTVLACVFAALGYFAATTRHLEESASIEALRRDMYGIEHRLDITEARIDRNDRDMYYFAEALDRGGIRVAGQ